MIKSLDKLYEFLHDDDFGAPIENIYKVVAFLSKEIL